MKALMVMGQTDRKLIHYVSSITKIDKITEVIVFREKNGPPLNKVQYRTIPSWSAKLPILKDLIKVPLLIYTIIREHPDFIHGIRVHPWGLMSLFAGKLMGIKTGVMLIAGPVEMCTLMGSGVGKHIYASKNVRINCNLFMRSLLQKFDYILVTGTFSKKILEENGLDSTKIHVLPRVSPLEFDTSFVPYPCEKIYDLIFVGRFAPVKNVETFIKSISLMIKRYPELRVVLVGGGEYQINLEQLAKSLEVEKNIDFVGYQKDVWRWYNKSKLSIISSEREGFPYSSIESLACGVPVVSSKCGDIIDVIIDGYNGAIIEDCYDAEAFSDAILKILKDQRLLTQLSQNALDSAHQLSFEKATHVWEQIIELLESGNARG